MKRFWMSAVMGAALAATSFGGDWPQFCGPSRNNVSAETGLASTWPEVGPKVLWEKSIADGYSSPAIKGGKVYFIDRENEESVLRCLDLTKGDELWKCTIDDPGTMSHKKFAGTRGTPTVTDNAVYFVTGWGTLVCVDIESGSVRWHQSLLNEFDMELHKWGMSQSPCLYKDLVMVAPTDKNVGVAAFNRKNGELVWKSKSIGGYTFASPVVYTICGVDMVVAVGSEERSKRDRSDDAAQAESESPTSGVYGLSPEDGSVLWSYVGWQCRNAIPFPTPVPGNRLFIAGGYNAGSAMIKIEKSDTGFNVTELFKTADVGPQIHQPIYLDDGLLIANNDNNRNDGLISMKLDGTIAWRTKDIEGAPNFERGPFILADGKIIILDGKTGILYLLKADVSGYQQLASAQMVKENDMAWAPLALSDGKLLVRDWTVLKCVDLK